MNGGSFIFNKKCLPIFPTIEYTKTHILSRALTQICQNVVITSFKKSLF